MKQTPKQDDPITVILKASEIRFIFEAKDADEFERRVDAMAAKLHQQITNELVKRDIMNMKGLIK